MSIFALISGILSLLPGLIQVGESIYGAIKGQGALKKATVLGAVSGIVDAIGATPGNSATLAQKSSIIALASTVTDALVATYNAVGFFTGGQPIAVDKGSDR